MLNDTTDLTNMAEDTMPTRWLRLAVWAGLLATTVLFWVAAGVAFLRWLV